MDALSLIVLLAIFLAILLCHRRLNALVSFDIAPHKIVRCNLYNDHVKIVKLLRFVNKLSVQSPHIQRAKNYKSSKRKIQTMSEEEAQPLPRTHPRWVGDTPHLPLKFHPVSNL